MFIYFASFITTDWVMCLIETVAAMHFSINDPREKKRITTHQCVLTDIRLMLPRLD